MNRKIQSTIIAILLALGTGCSSDRKRCIRQCEELAACLPDLQQAETCEAFCEHQPEDVETAGCSQQDDAVRDCLDDLEEVCDPIACLELATDLAECTEAFCIANPDDPICVVDPESCPTDEALGSALGEVHTGTTCGAGNQFSPFCVDGGADDLSFTWTAPADGWYAFSTFGSDYDTALQVQEGCGGAVLGCNDDTEGLTSQVVLELTGGELVTVVVDGYDSAECGAYALHVTAL